MASSHIKLLQALQVGIVLVGLTPSSFAQQTGDAPVPPVQFLKVPPNNVEFDPWSASPVPIHSGQAVYDDQAVDRSESYDGHPLQSHILVRSVGSSAQNALTPYLAKLIKREGGAAYAPQFSPDGHFVLFKYGGIGPNFPFEMYVLDTQSGSVKRVEDAQGQPYLPVFPELRWSPDSRYLVWVENLGLVGERLDPKEPGVLRVCDWRTGKSRVVAKGDEVRYSFSWSAPHTLLWSQLPPHATIVPAPQTSSSSKSDGASHPPSADTQPLLKEHPRLFEVDASSTAATSREVITDAFRATVSPSGKRLAFFGSYDVSKPYPLRFNWDEVSGSTMYLSVAQRDGSQRQAVNVQAGSYPQLLWQPDDKHLLTLEIERTSAYDPQALNKPGSFHITLRQFDVDTHKVRILATSLPGNDNDRLLSVSTDSKTLYLYVNEPLNLIKNSVFNAAYRLESSIIALDLQTGKRTLVARTINSLGLDWHEDSSPPTIVR